MRYDLQRDGLIVGVDKMLDPLLTVGTAFSYSKPELKTPLARMTVDDYTFGTYANLRIGKRWYANAFLGLGGQNYQYRRQESYASLHADYRNSYHGYSLYGSLELIRPNMRQSFGKDVILSPTFALDYQKSCSYTGVESGSGQFFRRKEPHRVICRD